MIDLAHFFQGMSPSPFASQARPESSPCGLLGPSGSGRSSLLFQYALQVASKGGSVMYVSSCKAADQKRPLLPAQFDEDEDDELAEAFERIAMKYITTRVGLDEFLSELYPRPELLIIDTWTTIMPPGTGSHDVQRTKSLLLGLTNPPDAICRYQIGADGEPAAQRRRTAALAPLDVIIAGTDEAAEYSEKIPWWEMCPLSIVLEPSTQARFVTTHPSGCSACVGICTECSACAMQNRHRVTMRHHKSREGRRGHGPEFEQCFSLESASLTLRETPI